MNKFGFSSLFGGLAALSSAQISIAVDHEYWNVQQGQSVTISGTITATGGLWVTNGGVEYARNASGILTNTVLTPAFIAYINGHSGKAFTGDLFTVTTSLATATGTYDQSNASDGLDFTRSETYLIAWDGSKAAATYGIVVTPVPEPASMAALGLGTLALLRRKRR